MHQFPKFNMAWNSTCPLSGVYSLYTPGPAQKLSSNLYDVYQCQVYSE